jgi:hypothetical protein
MWMSAAVIFFVGQKAVNDTPPAPASPLKRRHHSLTLPLCEIHPGPIKRMTIGAMVININKSPHSSDLTCHGIISQYNLCNLFPRKF